MFFVRYDLACISWLLVYRMTRRGNPSPMYNAKIVQLSRNNYDQTPLVSPEI
jgi:hypothetical protein